ncbi:hypothetical protein N9E02_01165 [Ilumatobacteraceae bacterium]|jgi:hypothetical protein|nr:hypothetical protein [Ilumatobacteraceae bacterium]
MRVNELIDILSDYPPNADVVVSVVAPVAEPTDDATSEILIDHYDLAGIHMPTGDRELVLLISGDDDDVDELLDLLETEEEIDWGFSSNA